MDFHVFSLRFKGPLHISGRATDSLIYPDKTIHSDTLSAAFAHALAMTGMLGNNDEEIAGGVLRFLSELPISSAFPYIKVVDEGGTAFHHFFPRPLSFVLSDAPEYRKKAKKVKWLSQPLFERIIYTGEKIPAEEMAFAGEAAGRADEPEAVISGVSELIVADDRLRVKLARHSTVEKRSDPYPITQVWFSRREKEGRRYESGLYFLVPADVPNELLMQVRSALTVLGDLGLGSDRAVGLGAFEWEERPLSLSTLLSEEAVTWLNLGMCIPPRQAWQEGTFVPKAYQLRYRSGWITSPRFLNVRRRSVYMLDEAGLFRLKSDASHAYSFEGAVVDLTPRRLNDPSKYAIEGMHPVYRSGKTILIPTKLNA